MNFAETVGLLRTMRDVHNSRGDSEQTALFRFLLKNITQSHAQLLQDLWVAFELGSPRNGFFVEFGACDGLLLSNSYYLETELNWTGILAEPARTWHESLRESRRCHVDERCVWARSGERVVFNETMDPSLSVIDSFSADDLHAPLREGGARYEVETISLNDLLSFWNAPKRIDYLSIDTEGSELEILRAFDFSAYDVRTITVEHNHTANRQPLFDLLTAQGYRRKFESLSGFDDWYVKATPVP